MLHLLLNMVFSLASAYDIYMLLWIWFALRIALSADKIRNARKRSEADRVFDEKWNRLVAEHAAMQPQMQNASSAPVCWPLADLPCSTGASTEAHDKAWDVLTQLDAH